MILRHLVAAAVGATIVFLAGCGSSEPTPEEKAAAAQRSAAEQHNRLIEQLTSFPAVADEMTSHLTSLEPRDVSDMEAAVDTVQLFEQAARNVTMVEDAVTAGEPQASGPTLAAKDRLKAMLTRKQRALFPAMRRTYAAYMSDAVSGAMANFRAVGPSGKTLRGASPSFSSQETVVDAHYTLASQATRFRFTKAEYVYSLTGQSWTMKVHGRGDDDIGG